MLLTKLKKELERAKFTLVFLRGAFCATWSRFQRTLHVWFTGRSRLDRYRAIFACLCPMSRRKARFVERQIELTRVRIRSLGYYASYTFSRTLCAGVFFYTAFRREKLKAASIEILPGGVRLADLLWRLSQLTAYALSVSAWTTSSSATCGPVPAAQFLSRTTFK